MEIPSWITVQNASKLVVVILAMMMHYHFILARFKAASDEAIKVLENLPESEQQ